MSIDFNKFVGPKEIIVPIVDGFFQYNRKKYSPSNKPCDVSGWWRVQVEGNNYKELEPAFPEVEFPDIPTIKGYTYNNNMIFQNFDVGRKKTGLDMMSELYFNNAPSFSSIKSVFWEDGCLYYYGVNYTDYFINEVKAAFDEDKTVADIKGMTPELKTLYVFHELERQAIREAEVAKRRADDLKKWQESLPGRLHLAFTRVGGKVLEYSITGDRIVVIWELEETGRKYNSVVNAKTFQTIQAGFCMSGDDKRHNITTMVLTAKEYERDRLTYITRSTRDDYYNNDEDEW